MQKQLYCLMPSIGLSLALMIDGTQVSGICYEYRATVIETLHTTEVHHIMDRSARNAAYEVRTR